MIVSCRISIDWLNIELNYAPAKSYESDSIGLWSHSYVFPTKALYMSRYNYQVLYDSKLMLNENSLTKADEPKGREFNGTQSKFSEL